MKKLFFIFSLLVISKLVIGQKINDLVIINLKSGFPVKGTVTEIIPNDYIKIKLTNEEVLKVLYSEVKSIKIDENERIKLNTQAQYQKGHIGLSMGPSIPLGDFASKNIDNSNSGFANTGAFLDISFAYKLGYGNFGLTALLRGQSNPINAQALVNEMAQPIIVEANWIENTSWNLGGLMFGGFGSFPISQKISFDTRAMIGFLRTTSPETTVTFPGLSKIIIKQSVSATSFAYSMGIGFRFELGEKLDLLTNLDYLGSNSEFKNVATTFNQSIKTINLSIGIALKL